MRPIIYRGPQDTGYTPTTGAAKFGELGEVYAFTIHHSAGPRARTKEQACKLHKAYQQSHINRGFGDIGYHLSMDDKGRFYILRSTKYKGAHVGEHNTGNIGLMIHGNYDHDRLTIAQRGSLKWLFRGGFLILTGYKEGTFDLVRGHQEWSGHASNACPGKNLMRHLRYLRNKEL